MITDKEIKGNLFIYCFFQISNICLCVLGFFTFAISIYLMSLSKSLNYFNCIFCLFGIGFIILSYFGCKLRNAPFGNLVYSVILSAIFFCYMIMTIVLFVAGDQIINSIMENYETSEDTKSQVKAIITKNYKIAQDLILIILLILICVVIFSWCYRKSLLSNQAEWNRSLLE